MAGGHRVVNLAVTLGRPGQEARRRAEAGEACARAGLELVVYDPAEGLVAAIRAHAAAIGAALVVAPSPEDGHPAHEAVGRAAVEAAAAARLWQWGLWADLREPTLFAPFGEERLAAQLHALAAHAGELARTDLAALVRARATANRVLGVERVFGFGASGRPEPPYAELLRERIRTPEGWRAGEARVL